MGVVPPSGSISWLNTLGEGSSGRVMIPPVGAGVSGGMDVSSIVTPSLPAGGYMGEGLLPIPEKLVKKILNLDFVELREMLPEAWLREEEEVSSKMCWSSRRGRLLRSPILFCGCKCLPGMSV